MDGNHDAFGWVGDPEHETAKFIMMFSRKYWVKHVNIYWRVRPKKYELQVYKWGIYLYQFKYSIKFKSFKIDFYFFLKIYLIIR